VAGVRGWEADLRRQMDEGKANSDWRLRGWGATHPYRGKAATNLHFRRGMFARSRCGAVCALGEN